MTSWLKWISVGAFVLMLAACGQSDTQSSTSPQSASPTSPLQAFIECDYGRNIDALSAMRLAGEYGNGKIYLPNEPLTAFGMPVAAVLVYDAIHLFGTRQPPTELNVDASPEFYSVTFLSAPGSAAEPAFAAWASSRGEVAGDPPLNADEEVDALLWSEASAIQSVAPGSMPAELGALFDGIGNTSIVPLSRVITSGGGIAYAINLEATETGTVSAVHCPGYLIFGGM